MGMKRQGSCGRGRSRDWRVENANSDAVKERPVGSSRRVVLEGRERESPPGIRGMVAKRMPSFCLIHSICCRPRPKNRKGKKENERAPYQVALSRIVNIWVCCVIIRHRGILSGRGMERDRSLTWNIAEVVISRYFGFFRESSGTLDRS